MTVPSFSSSWLGSLALVFCAYQLALVIYRLFFHPLANFPGPKLASFSYLYEKYHDLLRGGQYTFVIRDMHTKYGPIVRVSPDEVHIDDPDFFPKLYTGANNPRDRWARTADIFDMPTAHFTAVSAELHRARRTPMNPFFAKRTVTALAPSVVRHVEKLGARMQEVNGTGKVLSLKYAYSALALDIITEYAFGKSYLALDHEAFSPQWLDTVDGMFQGMYLKVELPWFAATMKRLPLWVTRMINPAMMELIQYQAGLRAQIESLMHLGPNDEKSQLEGQPTVFHSLLQSPALLPSDRDPSHFQDEGLALVAAAQSTTANHLSVTTFHLLANPSMFARLRAELTTAMPDPAVLPPPGVLEDLPYLSAVICEGHRFAHGIVHRSHRISPAQPITYKEYTIPPGTPVGMSQLVVHTNPEIYPEPDVFDPERFLGAEGAVRRQRYLVPFGKGTRSCLGMNLATAELYLTLAMVVRRFDLLLWETDRSDVDVQRDFFVPMPRAGSQGVRVTVEG